jgi:hypothetical protein
VKDWALQGKKHSFTWYQKCFGQLLGATSVRTSSLWIRIHCQKNKVVSAEVYVTMSEEHLPIILDANSDFMRDNASIQTAQDPKIWLKR